MAQLGRRARQRRTKDLIFGTIGFLLVLGIIGGVTYYMSSRPASLDKESLCPASGPTGHYVLLVDKTDPLTFTQKEAFTVTLRELVEKRIPEGYLLSVFVLGEDFKETAKPLIERCNPGRHAQADRHEYAAKVTRLDQDPRHEQRDASALRVDAGQRHVAVGNHRRITLGDVRKRQTGRGIHDWHCAAQNRPPATRQAG